MRDMNVQYQAFVMEKTGHRPHRINAIKGEVFPQRSGNSYS